MSPRKRAGAAQESVGSRVTPMPADLVRKIGALLGDAREDAGLSQSAAARALGMPQSRIAKLELGRRQLLLSEALLLAELYGVPVTAFDPRLKEPRHRSGRRRRVDV